MKNILRSLVLGLCLINIIHNTSQAQESFGPANTLSSAALKITGPAQISSGLYPVYSSTLNPGSITLATPGTGYVPGDVITLAISGATQTTAAGLGVATVQVVSATVAVGGSSCTNGSSQTVTGTTGTGTKFQALVTVAGNTITNVNSISVAGDYTVKPTTITAEPVTGDSCSGSQLSVVLGVLTAQPQGPNVGLFTAIPGPTAIATQASTTGVGSGATFNVGFTAPYTFFSAESGLYAPVIYGPGAGALIAGANELTAYGYHACAGVVNANENTCLGWQAGGLQNGPFNTFISGSGVLLSGTGQSNSICCDSAVRNGTNIQFSTLFGTNALQNYNGSGIGFITGFGQAVFQNLNSNTNNVSAAIGYLACGGAAGSTFNAITCLGGQTGGVLSTATNSLIAGKGVGNATFASGSGVILIGSGNVTVDTPAGGTSNYINIENVITATGTSTAGTSIVSIAGGLSVVGTSLPTQAAGTLGLGGVNSVPTLAANGEGDIYLDTTNGLTLIGQGSANDFQLLNRSGGTVCTAASGASLFTCGRIAVTSSTVPSNGMYLPSASTLGLAAGTTSVVQMTSTTFVLQTGIAFTAPSTVTLSGVTTGTNADFLCLSAGAVVLLQTTACTISSMRFKNYISDVSPDEALSDIMNLKPIAFTMKEQEQPNRDWNFDKPQIGLAAENVAAVNRKLAVYEQDGETPKSYRQEAIIAELVGAIQEQQHEINSMRRYLGMAK